MRRVEREKKGDEGRGREEGLRIEAPEAGDQTVKFEPSRGGYYGIMARYSVEVKEKL